MKAITSKETSPAPGRICILAVDSAVERLEALKKAGDGRTVFYGARNTLEAFYWADQLGSVDALILQDPGAFTAKPLDFFRALHDALHEADKTLKVLVVRPEEESIFKVSPLLAPADLVIARDIAPELLWQEVRRRLARRARERRGSLRLRIPESATIRIDAGNGPARLGDISETGMFVKSESPGAVGESRTFLIHVSDLESWKVDGLIVRTDPNEAGFGVAFRDLDEPTRRALFGLLADAVSLNDLAGLKKRYPFLNTDDMVSFQSPEKIAALIEDVHRSGEELMALSPITRRATPLRLVRSDAPGVCLFEGQELDVRFKTGDPVFISFQGGYATYNFETTVRRIAPGGKSLECFAPRVMFYSEKRSLKRETPAGPMTLEVELPAPFRQTVRGAVADISDGGVSFIPDDPHLVLLPGTPLESIRVLDGLRVLREGRGEVRYAASVDGNGLVKYGLQFGIGRMAIQATRTVAGDKAAAEAAAAGAPRRTDELEAIAGRPPEVVRLENALGEEIVGLLNTSLPLDERPVPVVIIPPAFGKTKETLFGLALMLVQNFALLGQPLAVLRYDGVRRKGESHKDPEAAEPPFEMVKATLSQGAEDLKAVLDWLQHNPRVRARKVILVSFSLSALEARILLRDEAQRRRVDSWIACMGTLEFRHLMNRVNCGLDLLEQHQLGIDMGIIPILGNLVSMAPYAADVVRSGVATLEQARDDMRHIDIPVTWIYGEHDHWIKAEFVRDVLSVRAPADREVIAVPIGHAARTSEDALRLFGTITALVHRRLHGEMIHPVLPSRADLEALRHAEKDRLPARKPSSRRMYWRRYLLGEDDTLGFDILRMSDDYRRLMEDQLEALDLQPADRLLDLGGGTGNFIEHLLETGRGLPERMTLADLVPEALARARGKLVPGLDRRSRGESLETVLCDVEMNRFAPVRRFLNGEIGRFTDLVDKIENLGYQSAERIQKAYSPRLHRLLRGEELGAAADRWLRSHFDLPEQRIITDFNRAARMVRGEASGPATFRALEFPGGLDANLHLPFRAESFDKVLMSLVLSYIFDPAETLREVRRILRPGGRLVLSSMRPDTDSSGLFTRLVEKIEARPAESFPPERPKRLILDSIRAFLNDAQALVELEEAGTFDFFDPEKLEVLLEEAGWERIKTIPTFGDPPQGYIVVARAQEKHV